MPLSNDFKAKIKDGKIKEALEMALAEAVELKITTWVAQEGQENGSASAEVSPSQRLETRINLLSNEIATEVGQEFADGGVYSQLKVFHQEQVNQSHRLIQNNINCLQRLLSLWGRLDPAIATSIPALEDNLIESREPLLISDDADFASNALPASTPAVASSVAETPIISVPQADTLTVESEPVAESTVSPDRDSLLEDEYKGLETSKLGTTHASEAVEESFTPETPVAAVPETDTTDDNSGFNLPGMAAAAGVGMLGMNLYQSFQGNRETDEPQSESPEAESLFGFEAETPVAEPASDPVDLNPFSDFSAPTSATSADALLAEDRAFEFDLSAEAPAIADVEAPHTDNLISSGWNDESWVPSEIPSIEDLKADEIEIPSTDNLADVNRDEGSFTPALEDNVDISSWTAEVPSTTPEELENSDNLAVSDWSDEGWNQADVPSLQDLSADETPAPSADVDAGNWDGEAFAPSDLETPESTPTASENIDLSSWTTESETESFESVEIGENIDLGAENADLSSWSEETWVQPEVTPSQDSFADEILPSTSDVTGTNWDEETFVPSNLGDLGTAEIAPPVAENADLSSWSEETWVQPEVTPSQDSFADEILPSTSDVTGTNWDDETFVPSNLGDLGTAEIAPPVAENGDLSSWTLNNPAIADVESEDVAPQNLENADLSGLSQETWDRLDVPASQDLNIGEPAISADESVGLFDSQPTAEDADSIESFDDLATVEVDIFAEVGDEEIEGIDRAYSTTENLAIASPEVAESDSESGDADFNLPGAAALGGLGVAGLGVFAAQSHAEEAMSELPQAEFPTSLAADTAEVPTTISSLDDLVFDDSPSAEAEATSDRPAEDAILNTDETPGLWASPGVDNFDMPQESADVLFDGAQMSEWVSASSLETPSEAPETDMASWTFGDATPSISEEPSLEVSETDMASWTFGDATPSISEEPSLEVSETDMASWTFGDATPSNSEELESSLETLSETPADDIAAWNPELSDASLETLSEVSDSDLDGWDLGDLSELNAEPTEIEMPKWNLADSSPVAAEPLTAEGQAVSWETDNLSASGDWDANNFDLGLSADDMEALGDEANLLTPETGSDSGLDDLDDVLATDSDLSGWEIESSLPAETQIDSELDSLIESEDLDDFNLSTPEVWDNWQDENLREDSIAALERLSNDPDPIELGGLNAEAGNWDVLGEGDQLADPFASANLDGIDDWQLIAPETSQASSDRSAEDLDLFLNSPESDKFPTDSKNAATPDPLSLDEELSLWSGEEDPFADIFSMESSESTEKQK